MKTLERLGAWIISGWIYWAITALSITLLVGVVLSPRSVSLSEREFKCVESEPDGLNTRCVTYTRRVR